MDNLLMLKTQRVVYLSLLNDGNIIDAIKIFEKYQNQLKTYANADEEIQKYILKEINSSRNIFMEKLNQTAKIYMEKEDYNKAAVCLSEVILYNDENQYAIMDYIVCLHKMEQYELKNQFLRHLLKIVTYDNILVYKKLALFYNNINEYENAIENQEKYLSLCEKDKIDYQNYLILGQIYNNLYSETLNISYLDKGMSYFKIAEKINPNDKEILNLIVNNAFLANNDKLASDYLDKIFKYGNVTNEEKFNYSIINFRMKNFKNFYKYYDARFFREDKKLKVFFPNIDKPQWKGENISDKTLLVHGEQGFGDTILTWGYAERLSKLAKHVIFVVKNELYCLLQNNEWNIQVLPFTTSLSNINFDCYVMAMSIPAVLNLNENNISVGQGFIKSTEYLTEDFKQKFFNTDKLKIGLSFSGKISKNPLSNYRNIPIKEFLPLDNLDNVKLYSLTKGLKDEDFEDFKKNKIHNLSNYLLSFTHTASLMDNCDLIIASDNCLLNLAGALGKKTFGLFNWYYEYRWYDLTGEDVGWFTSVKPFVNTSMNDWQSSMTRVVEEIKQIQTGDKNG